LLKNKRPSKTRQNFVLSHSTPPFYLCKANHKEDKFSYFTADTFPSLLKKEILVPSPNGEGAQRADEVERGQGERSKWK